MDLPTLAQAMTLGGVVEVLAAGTGLSGVLVFGVLMLQRKPVPPAVLVGAVACPSVVATGIAGIVLWPGVASVEAYATAAGCRGLAILLTAPLATLALIFTVVVAVRSAPRRFGLVFVVALAVVLLMALTWFDGWNPEFSRARALLYLLFGLPLSVSMVRGGTAEAERWPEGSVVAALCVALIVGVAEASERALAELLMMLQLAKVAPDLRSDFVERAFEVMSPMTHGHFVSIMVGGMIPIGVGVASALAVTGKRRLWVALSVLWVLWLPGFYYLGQIGPERMKALGLMLP